jgi:hypothetical protein
VDIVGLGQHIRIHPLKLRFGLPILAMFGLVASPAHALRESIAYQKLWVAGVPAHVVTIDLNDKDVRLSPVMPRYGVGRSESWGAMVGRARPTAAITGTFFDTRSLYPTGDILIDGNLICRGVTGTALCIGWNNEISFIPLKRGQSCNWSAYQHVLVAGPSLLSGGKLAVYPRDQGFRDGGLFSRRPRTAVGFTEHGKLVMFVTKKPVYLSHLARALRSLGVMNAAALDGGGSTALYYRGKSFAAPRRRMTNLLAAYDSESVYKTMKPYLAPATIRLLQASASR